MRGASIGGMKSCFFILALSLGASAGAIVPDPCQEWLKNTSRGAVQPKRDPTRAYENVAYLRVHPQTLRSDDGQWTAYLENESGIISLVHAGSDSQHYVRLFSTPDPVAYVGLSRGGRYLAAITRAPHFKESSVYIWDALSRSEEALVEFTISAPRAPFLADFDGENLLGLRYNPEHRRHPSLPSFFGIPQPDGGALFEGLTGQPTVRMDPTF